MLKICYNIHAMYNKKASIMSFDFNSNINPINKAQAAYKDGGGMGGGGMYFQQGKKRKEDKEEDLFERTEENVQNEISFDADVKEEDIPQNNLFNKFVNWFRIKEA